MRALPLAPVARAPAALAEDNAYGREDEEAHGGDDTRDDWDLVVGVRSRENSVGGRLGWRHLR
jgi:hypothetical protein